MKVLFMRDVKRDGILFRAGQMAEASEACGEELILSGAARKLEERAEVSPPPQPPVTTESQSEGGEEEKPDENEKPGRGRRKK